MRRSRFAWTVTLVWTLITLARPLLAQSLIVSVRQDVTHAPITGAIVSVITTGDTTIAGSDDPATAFLAKPFDGDDLLRAVRSTLDGAKTPRT